MPDEVEFQTKPQIALDLIDRAKANGIRVLAWTADEAYGRNTDFLDGLDKRSEAFVVEVPPNARVWMEKPEVLQKRPSDEHGGATKYPRLGLGQRSPSEVRNLTATSQRARNRCERNTKRMFPE